MAQLNKDIPVLNTWSELEKCITPVKRYHDSGAIAERNWISSDSAYSTAPSRPHRARRKSIENEKLLKAVEAIVAPLRKKVAELEAKFQIPSPPAPNEFETWISSPEVVKKFGGQFVAFSAPGVIEEHAETDDELMDKIAEHPDKEKLLIDRVPRA